LINFKVKQTTNWRSFYNWFNKMLKTSKRESTQSKEQRTCKSCRRRKFCTRCRSMIAKFAKINAEAHICAKSSSSHKRKCKCKHKCKCECKCRRMKPDYQKILAKVTRDIISRKKIDNHFEKWELNLTSDENAQCNEQRTEEDKVWHKSRYSD